METTFVVGNMAWNAGLVTVAGFLVKRWMDRIDEERRIDRLENKKTASDLATALKEQVEEHREDLKSHSMELSTGLGKIYDQLRVANGRTGKIEQSLEVQKALCEERMKMRSSSNGGC